MNATDLAQGIWFKLSLAKQAIESLDYVNNRMRKWTFESFITLKCVDKYLSVNGKLLKNDKVLKYKLYYYRKSIVGIDYDAMAVFTYIWTSIPKLLKDSEEFRENLFSIPNSDPSYYVCPSLMETIKDINWFLNKSSFYNEKGITFKRSYFLIGPPGTGKSKFIEYVKTHADLNKSVINVRRKFAKDVIKISNNADQNNMEEDSKIAPILIIEDLDRINFDEINLSAFLNFLDGDDREGLLFITCNDQSKIPSVILRPGRVDVTTEFKLLADDGLLFIANNIFNQDAAKEVVDMYKKDPLEFDKHLDRFENINTPAHFTNYCTKKLVSMRQ